MTDVHLFNEPDGGNIEVLAGSVTMSDGLYTAAYLSLYGGNEDDSGSDADKARQWWGNLSETEPEKRYRSRSQNILHALELTPSILGRIEDATSEDLQWLLDTGYATEVSVAASMPALNTVKREIDITVNGETFHLEFTDYGTVKGL